MTQLSELRDVASEALDRREAAGELLAADAEKVARACYDMALRFHRGGRLIVFGNGGAGTDANHIAVEFVHPVIVGKRALPALALTNDVATLTGVANQDGFVGVFAHQLRHLGAPEDIALGLSPDGWCANVRGGLEAGRELGMLTIAFTGGDGGEIAQSPAVDHLMVARSDDSAVVTEVHTTAYHILWELVHVFFEQPGVLEPEVVA